jgi:hypothetical protein
MGIAMYLPSQPVVGYRELYSFLPFNSTSISTTQCGDLIYVSVIVPNISEASGVYSCIHLGRAWFNFQ